MLTTHLSVVPKVKKIWNWNSASASMLSILTVLYFLKFILRSIVLVHQDKDDTSVDIN
jgi:hypothetical protein